jgi:competence protein ComEA
MSKNGGSGELVNINTADEKALDTLPGIGPAMAKRIIEYRETEGLFQSIEDIKKSRGIGDAKFEKLKDKICI